MIVVYTEDFYNCIDKIKDVATVERAFKTIQKLKSANSLREITNVKAIQDWHGFYRIRFGDFRIGFQLIDKNTIKLFTVDHRSKVYKHFPKNYA